MDEQVDLSQLSMPPRRRRLTAPSARAYAPSQSELTILSQMNQPGAAQMVGFLAGAMGDRERAGEQHSSELARTQQAETQLAQVDARNADMASRRRTAAQIVQTAPEALALFPDITNMAPASSMAGLQQIGAARLANRNSDTARDLAAANASNRSGQGGGGSNPSEEATARSDGALLNRAEIAGRSARSQARSAALRGLGIASINGIPLPGARALTPQEINAVNLIGQEAFDTERGANLTRVRRPDLITPTGQVVTTQAPPVVTQGPGVTSPAVAQTGATPVARAQALRDQGYTWNPQRNGFVRGDAFVSREAVQNGR